MVHIQLSFISLVIVFFSCVSCFGSGTSQPRPIPRQDSKSVPPAGPKRADAGNGTGKNSGLSSSIPKVHSSSTTGSSCSSSGTPSRSSSGASNTTSSSSSGASNTTSSSSSISVSSGTTSGKDSAAAHISNGVRDEYSPAASTPRVPKTPPNNQPKVTNHSPADNRDFRLQTGWKIGSARGDGNCFFDAFAQGLNQAKPEAKYDVKKLRESYKYFICKCEDEDKALYDKIKSDVIRDARHGYGITRASLDVNGDDLWNAYLVDIEKVSDAGGSYNSKYGSTLQPPIWGRPDIEGLVLCTVHKVTLYMFEKHEYENTDGIYMVQRIDASGSQSISLNDVKYDVPNSIYIVNNGNSHFDPILKKQ